MKNKVCIVVAIVLIAVSISTFFVACTDKNKKSDPTVEEQIKDAIKNKAMVDIALEYKGAYYYDCTVKYVKTTDGYNANGKVFAYTIKNGERKEYKASYLASLDDSFKVTAFTLGSFYLK